MRLIFPSSLLDPKKPDEMYEDQVQAFRQAGFEISLVSLDDLKSNSAKISPAPSEGEHTLYRGWMLDSTDFEKLVDLVKCSNACPLISLETYLATHHLPNWYPLLEELTPETKILPVDCNLEAELKALGWEQFFIKDYVKSLKTSVGSIIDDPSKVHTVVEEMIKFRDTIEGGFCIRRVEAFDPASEIRYFIVKGQPFAAGTSDEVPSIVKTVVERIDSPFFSVDIVRRSDGELRVVEVGDGQVSDIVGWSPNRLTEIWRDAG